MSQDFRPPFFHDLNPFRPLINRLKYFKILKSYAVCIIPQSQALQCVSHCGVKLCSVHHTAESSDQKFFFLNSAVCISPWSQTLWCTSLRGVKLPDVHHTAESISYQVSGLIQSFTNAISLRCLKILV